MFTLEQEINLRLARKVAAILRDQGVDAARDYLDIKQRQTDNHIVHLDKILARKEQL